MESDSGSSSASYFDLLSARPDCHVAFSLRNQAEIDSIPSGGAAPGRAPVIYDSAHDAMLQRTKGPWGINAEQKQPRLGVKRSSMLLTWEFKIGPGAQYQGDGFLKQYKAYRIDQGTNTGLWLSFKTRFPVGNNGIAEFLTTGGLFMGPGTTNANSEILEPRVARFWPKVNTWTRVWTFVEGSLGGGPVNPAKPNSPVSTEIVHVSIWAADENTAPVQLYDRLPMYSPVEDIRQFRLEFNTSETGVENPLMEFWNRNMIVLKGLTLASAKSLLQKP